MLDLEAPNDALIWAVTLLAFFFMMRKSEFLAPAPGAAALQPGRCPLRAMDLEARRAGARTHWGDRPDEVVICLAGSKADQRAKGISRNHSGIPAGAPNHDLCHVAALSRVARPTPSRMVLNAGLTFARWASNGPMSYYAINLTLRAAAQETGENPFRRSI